MKLLEEARRDGNKLVESGDPDRAILMKTTPFHLATIHLAMAHYTSMMSTGVTPEIVREAIDEAWDDVRSVMGQVLTT